MLHEGRHGEVIGELEGLVVREPLREQLWALLMSAYVRSGRQADALGSFARARRALSEELGIEPGPQLRSLQTRGARRDRGRHARTTRSAPRAPRSGR